MTNENLSKQVCKIFSQPLPYKFYFSANVKPQLIRVMNSTHNLKQCHCEPVLTLAWQSVPCSTGGLVSHDSGESVQHQRIASLHSAAGGCGLPHRRARRFAMTFSFGAEEDSTGRFVNRPNKYQFIRKKDAPWASFIRL